MQIGDIAQGLAAGVGIDLSPDGKVAYYVEWSIGELSKVDVKTGMMTTVGTGLSYPEDVEVDWSTGEVFVSERTGAVKRFGPGKRPVEVVKPEGAPHQLHLTRKGGKRHLYTVCYDSGKLIRIDVDAKTTQTIAIGLGHPVGVVIDGAEQHAYITEQDPRSLTRVELSSGTAKRLHTGLVSPFFLAWDRTAKAIFCVQRDPANNLLRLELGPPVTAKVVAGGLAWRPSGVAPNADDTLIYVCADRELEVISFDGAPAIKPPRPPFEVRSIQFHFQRSAAIGLKDHVAGAPVPVPEYVKGLRSGPAAYVKGALPRVRVVLRKLPGFVSGAYAIGATGNLGGIRRKTVTPVFNAAGMSSPIDFELMWPLPSSAGKPNLNLEWYARRSPGPSIPCPIGSTAHRLYLVVARPTEPWVTELPWVAALEIACGWAAGATTLDVAATRITDRYYHSGNVRYDDVVGATHYGLSTYMLSQMIDRLNGGTGLGEIVNCTDSADTVSTLSNLLGCDLWQSRMGYYFDLNPILAIGFPPPDPWPQWPGFRYHEVAWKGACTESESVFDGCLMVDGDSDPTSPPHAWVLPTNMLFGDCTTMNYRLRLCPPTPGGCAACLPQPSTRTRRPLG